jgi:hypothetical protein
VEELRINEKRAKRIEKELMEVEPQKTLSTKYEPLIEQDPDCMYSKSCDMPSCLGCRRLK